jgi:hypothetical protein
MTTIPPGFKLVVTDGQSAELVPDDGSVRYRVVGDSIPDGWKVEDPHGVLNEEPGLPPPGLATVVTDAGSLLVNNEFSDCDEPGLFLPVTCAQKVTREDNPAKPGRAVVANDGEDDDPLLPPGQRG